MSGTFYRALGFLVWKGTKAYMRQRYGSRSRMLAASALTLLALAGAAALAQRRGAHAD